MGTATAERKIVRVEDLHNTEGTSDKVYHVAIRENDGAYEVLAAYGRRGGGLKHETKTDAPTTLDSATKTLEKLVTQKKAKGYEPAAGISGKVFE